MEQLLWLADILTLCSVLRCWVAKYSTWKNFKYSTCDIPLGKFKIFFLWYSTWKYFKIFYLWYSTWKIPNILLLIFHLKNISKYLWYSMWSSATLARPSSPAPSSLSKPQQHHPRLQNFFKVTENNNAIWLFRNIEKMAATIIK